MLNSKKTNILSNKWNEMAKQALNHWIVQRVTALFLLVPMLALLYSLTQTANTIHFDTYNGINLIIILSVLTILQNYIYKLATLLALIIICIHLMEGIENIIMDYVHNEKTKILIGITLKCIQIELIKSFYILIFL